MEELIKRFAALDPEDKITFFKQIMPEVFACFNDNPENMMEEMMPLCMQLMPQFLQSMKEHNLENMMSFMKMMNKTKK